MFDFIRLLVRELSSIPTMSPIVVTIRAICFMNEGMVMVIEDEGGIVVVRRNPAKIVPSASRIMGLIRLELFSLRGDIVMNRGYPRRA